MGQPEMQLQRKTNDQTPPDALPGRFTDMFGGLPDILARAPGRADLIGTHVDYNDGAVLTAAISRSAWVAAKSTPGARLTVHSLDMDQGVTFDPGTLEARQDVDHQPLPDWALYPAGVAWAMMERGAALQGCQMMITSSVPVAAGLSSSAAVELAYATAWAEMAGWPADRMTLARLCQRAENEYVGVNSGLMDQFSSAFGQTDHALLFDCRTLEWEAIRLGGDVTLVVANTGTHRTLSTSRYNERRGECDEAVRILGNIQADIRALRDVSIEFFAAHQDLLPQPVRNRARHIVEEMARVRRAAQALQTGDVTLLGQLMDESQASSRDLFEASGPALDAMWNAAQGHPARLGGRFLGAGWAGCMIFLIDAADIVDFIRYTGGRYQAETGIEPAFYPMKAAQGAEIVPVE